MKRCAICMKGAVQLKGLTDHFYEPDSIYKYGCNYINLDAVSQMIKRHIVKCNPDYQFDIFIHCWNKDLEKKLCELYDPIASEFEDNGLYRAEIFNKCRDEKDYGGISSALSIQKCINLKKKYEEQNNFVYDTVIIYRHDIYLWKDIELNKYDMNYIYVNGVLHADFHFIMNTNNANRFAGLYNSIDDGNVHRIHHWIQNYVENMLHIQLKADDILPGKFQESPKALKLCSFDKGYLTLDIMNEYGLNESDLYVYAPNN